MRKNSRSELNKPKKGKPKKAIEPAAVIEPLKRQPTRFSLLLESRALLDIASVPLSLAKSKFSAIRGEGPIDGALPIIMFPGFSSDERYLKALEFYLRDRGYQTEGWGLGVNLAGLNIEHKLEDLSPIWEFEFPQGYTPETYKGEGGVPLLCEKAIARVKQRSAELGSPIVIIGWSLGGYIAREVARELPDEVAQIITFGAPVQGGPKYSRAADIFRAKGQDLDWIERSIEKRDSKKITQPITSIYSKSDGIVSYTAAVDTISPNVENIQIDAAHLGMGFNRQVWKVVAKALKDQAELRCPEQ